MSSRPADVDPDAAVATMPLRWSLSTGGSARVVLTHNAYPGALLLPLEGDEPDVANDAWIAPGTVLVGQVSVGPRASIWYGSVVRADNAEISIGEGSNVQDGCVLHTDPEQPLAVGMDVTIGHAATIHGSFIGDGVLLGMGCVISTGVRIGDGSVVAAGCVIPAGREIAPGSLVVGVPGHVARAVRADERLGNLDAAQGYAQRAKAHRLALSAKH